MSDRSDTLREALRRLTFAARTSGGTAGPDAELMLACEEAERALAHPPESVESVPDDWKLVPITPTPEMERAAFDELELQGTATETGTQMRNRVYGAMLAAAPSRVPGGRHD